MPIEPERAERVKRFIERFCTYSTGTKFKGKPFQLLPWQYDDVIVPFYDMADSIVEPLIEKIDIDGDGK